MTIKEISIEEVNRSVREMTEAASRVARDINGSISEVNKAMQAALEASRLATARAEEILTTAKNTAEEAVRTVREAVDSAKSEADKAAETARSVCQQTASQAEEKNRSTREWAEATARSSQETIGKAINDAGKALEAAEKVSGKMVSRTEEFSIMAKRVAEESCKAAREAAEIAIKQATSAEAITQEALRQAADRAEAISNLARSLAEQAARTAIETSECVKKAFEDSRAVSVNEVESELKPDKEAIARIEETFTRQSFEADNLRNVAVVDNAQEQPPIAERSTPDEPLVQGEIPESNQPVRGTLISMLGNSLKNSIGKNRDNDRKLKEEAEKLTTGEAEQSVVDQPKPELDSIYAELTQYSSQPAGIDKEPEPDLPPAKEIKAGMEKEPGPGPRPAKEIKPDLIEGTVLIVAPCRGTTQLKDFEQQLKRLKYVKVLVTGASDRGSSKIVVSVERPSPLVQMLNELPIVKDVTKQGREVHVTL